MKSLGEQTKRIILFAVMLLMCMAAAFAVCGSKKGMHEDEYYSYYSSNRTDGLWTGDGVRTDRQTILNEFSVVEGKGFNFGLVKEVQSWDVHPPLYYFFLHFICSLTPGVFSKWQGLSLNLICLLVCLILMKYLGDMLMAGQDTEVTVLTGAWGVAASTLTGVVFIRMYMMLTMWILAVTILHMKRKDTPFFYVSLGVMTFLGFMTHYYFFIWLFFLAVAVNITDILKTRSIWRTLRYGITMVVTFGLCYLFYPVFPAQMFTGQRGAQATGNFFDISNTWQRICFFAEKINRIGYGSSLWIFILVTLVFGLAVGISYRRNGRKFGVNENECILAFALICYFLTVSKTALMLGDSSIRYHMPVIGISYLVMAAALFGSLKYLFSLKTDRTKPVRAVCIVFALELLILNICSDLNGNISFLYPEQAQNSEMLARFPDADMVYVYKQGNDWCVWDSTLCMLEKDSVLFCEDNDGPLNLDEQAENDEEILLFVEDVDGSVDTDAVIDKICGQCREISTCTYLFNDDYCDVYLCR